MFTIKYPRFYNQPQSNSEGNLGLLCVLPTCRLYTFLCARQIIPKDSFCKVAEKKNYTLAYHCILIHTLAIKMFGPGSLFMK